MSDKIILKHDNGIGLIDEAFPDQHLVHGLDVVAGNRYRGGISGTVTTDDAGPWLALVTYRGPSAPPRPEVLPIGTRVRRGADWDAAAYGSDPGPGIVTPDPLAVSDYAHVSFATSTRRCTWGAPKGPGSFECGHPWQAVEVVSLPEAKSERPETAFEILRCGDESWASNGWKANGQGCEYERVDEGCFRTSQFIKGRRYSIINTPERPASEVPRDGWLCVRDYTGPDYREPARAIHGQVVGDPVDVGPALGPSRSAAMPAAYIAPLISYTFTSAGFGAEMRKATESMVSAFWRQPPRVAKAPLDPYAAHRHALQEQGVECNGCRPEVPDYQHPRAALRARTLVVPTETAEDMPWLPDADETLAGRIGR